MKKTQKNNPKKKISSKPGKVFDAEYIFGGTWIGPKLCGSSTLKCTFTLEEIKRFGVKNVIKYYAIKYGIGEKQYNCFIAGFGKKARQQEKKEDKKCQV